MDIFEVKLKMLSQLSVKVTILQIIALCISCGIGIYLTINEMFFETLYIPPLHIIMMTIIIVYNKKRCKYINNYE